MRSSPPHPSEMCSPSENGNNLSTYSYNATSRPIWNELIELWSYRELIFFLFLRDYKVRYKQTLLGVAWLVIQPLVMTIAFTLLFSKLFTPLISEIPYWTFGLTGILPWTFFSYILNHTSVCAVSDANLIKKVYFPRLILPLSSVVSGLLDFAISLFIALVFLACGGIPMTINLLCLPVLIFLTLVTAFGIGLWLCALNVEYRDLRYTLPFFTQAWMFVSPVAYPSTLASEKWRHIYALNPMVGIIDGFRWAVLGTKFPDSSALTISVGASIFFLLTGLWYFRRLERDFADVI